MLNVVFVQELGSDSGATEVAFWGKYRSFNCFLWHEVWWELDDTHTHNHPMYVLNWLESGFGAARCGGLCSGLFYNYMLYTYIQSDWSYVAGAARPERFLLIVMLFYDFRIGWILRALHGTKLSSKFWVGVASRLL